MRALPRDSFLNPSNYDFMLSILGEINGRLSVPLEEPSEQQAPILDSPAAGGETEGEEEPSRQNSRKQDKRRGRDFERREGCCASIQ